MSELFVPCVLTPEGWVDRALIRWDAQGRIGAIEPNAEPGRAPRAVGPVVPGLVNLHSHSFQRAMAGRAEERTDGGGDDFWGWRETMYRLAQTLQPEDASAIARQLAVECLRRGFTGVCEFHYLHHNPDGRPYDDPAAMSKAVIDGLREAGIAVAHLPVLYATGGFQDAPLADRQRRFKTDPQSLLAIVETLRAAYAHDPSVRIGIAPHSVRAAPTPMIKEAVEGLRAMDGDAPIHIHVAEQVKEVEDCLAATGSRPLALLAERVGLDPRWCAVHATHLDAAEVRLLAASGAVAGLCPATEANLGDGLFPLSAYLAAGGRFGVGTDSHVMRDPARELALLEYGQRLVERRRLIAPRPARPSAGAALFAAAAEGGAQAAGRACGRIEVGAEADLVVLDGAHPDIAERTGDAILDGWLFAAEGTPVWDVYVSGKRVISGRRHALGVDASADYRTTLTKLFG
ncbi:MAG: formimidoylglutamate deiminase [Marivibrio sp.]|uniref:formimidoylglutamate deiminase n=1 Tax=Marivibrio sp. TaxID=2039719 RepID=UPI0032ED409A